MTDRDTALAQASEALAHALEFFVDDGFTDEQILERVQKELREIHEADDHD